MSFKLFGNSESRQFPHHSDEFQISTNIIFGTSLVSHNLCVIMKLIYIQVHVLIYFVSNNSKYYKEINKATWLRDYLQRHR